MFDELGEISSRKKGKKKRKLVGNDLTRSKEERLGPID